MNATFAPTGTRWWMRARAIRTRSKRFAFHIAFTKFEAEFVPLRAITVFRPPVPGIQKVRPVAKGRCEDVEFAQPLSDRKGTKLAEVDAVGFVGI